MDFRPNPAAKMSKMGWDADPEPMPDWDLIAQPDPGLEFDQRASPGNRCLLRPMASPPLISGLTAAPGNLIPRPVDARSRRFREARAQPRLSFDRPSDPR